MCKCTYREHQKMDLEFHLHQKVRHQGLRATIVAAMEDWKWSIVRETENRAGFTYVENVSPCELTPA